MIFCIIRVRNTVILLQIYSDSNENIYQSYDKSRSYGITEVQ